MDCWKDKNYFKDTGKGTLQRHLCVKARITWQKNIVANFLIEGLKIIAILGRSPEFVVMIGDSRSKGCGFKLQHRRLDEHFSHWFVVKNCIVCLRRPEINKKEAGVGPFKQIIAILLFHLWNARLIRRFKGLTRKLITFCRKCNGAVRNKFVEIDFL